MIVSDDRRTTIVSDEAIALLHAFILATLKMVLDTLPNNNPASQPHCNIIISS